MVSFLQYGFSYVNLVLSQYHSSVNTLLFCFAFALLWFDFLPSVWGNWKYECCWSIVDMVETLFPNVCSMLSLGATCVVQVGIESAIHFLTQQNIWSRNLHLQERR